MLDDAMEDRFADLVEEWHNGNARYPGQPLSDYLNLTHEQYALVVENKGFPEGYEMPPLGRIWGDDPQEFVDISKAIGRPGPCRPLAEFILICIGIGCVLAIVANIIKTLEGR